MKLIVLSTNYPKNLFAHQGTFIAEQVKAIKKQISGDITVISPVPWSIRILWFIKKWRKYGQIERENIQEEVKVYYPRYFIIPGKFFLPFRGFFIYLSTRLIIKKLLRTNKSKTILHSHSVLPEGLTGTLLKLEFNIPHLCTIHGSDINIYPYRDKVSYWLTKYVLKNCDYIVAVSCKLKEKAQLIVEGLSNILVIYNGADNKKFRPIPKELSMQKLGINERNKVIMFIGNLIPIKGVDNLIKAFYNLIEESKRDGISLYLIGDGSEKEKLSKLIKELKLEKKVLLLGGKSHDEIPLWLNIANIFVLTSFSEGFPTVIPEAMMCGIPVIASNVGGIPEIITNNKSGLLIKPGDTRQIKESIKRLLDNDSITQKILATAKIQSSKYTWDNNALKNIMIYNNLMYKQRPSKT